MTRSEFIKNEIMPYINLDEGDFFDVWIAKKNHYIVISGTVHEKIVKGIISGDWDVPNDPDTAEQDIIFNDIHVVDNDFNDITNQFITE